MIDKCLVEHGYQRQDLPDWIWKYPLGRCLETVGRVHLSADREYALLNSQAGKEAEVSLRTNLASFRRKTRFTPNERSEITYRVHEPYSVLLKVKIPLSWIHEFEDLQRRIPTVIIHTPSMSKVEAWDWLLQHILSVTVNEVPPERIIRHERVSYKRGR